MTTKKNTRGGTRQGSGAKPKYKEQTKTVLRKREYDSKLYQLTLKLSKMNCIAANCKHQCKYEAELKWKMLGTKQSIGFCDVHAPEWIKNIKVGEDSPPMVIMGINKSWYKRLK